MSDTTFEIIFKADQAFINSVSAKAQPVSTSQPAPPGSPGPSTERAKPWETAGKLAHQVASESGASDLAEQIKKQKDRFDQVREVFDEMLGGAKNGKSSTASPSGASTSQVAGQAGRVAASEASTAAAGGAAAEGGAAAGMGGTAVAGGAVAAVVVAGLLVAAALKKTADKINTETENLADFSPSIAISKDMLDLRREFMKLNRGEELAGQMSRWNSDKGKIEEAAYKAQTELLKLGFDAWDVFKPLAEVVHDVLKELRSWMAWARATWNASFGDPAKQRKLNEDADEANKEAKRAWDTDDLGGGSDKLDEEANAMSERLLSKFGMSGNTRPRITPRRDR